MKNKLFWIISAIVIVLLIIVAFIVKQTSDSNKSKKENEYQTYKVENEAPLSVSGKSSPNKIKTYNNNEQFGKVSNINVKDGQKVSEGETLLSYDGSGEKRQQLQESVDQASQAVEQTRQQMSDAKGSEQEKLQKELEKQQQEQQKAQKQLSQYDEQMNQSQTAEFSGKVEVVDGANAESGKPVLKLIADKPEIETELSEFDVTKVDEGDKVNIKVNSTGEKGKGEIKQVSELPTSYEEQGQSAGGASQMAQAQGGQAAGGESEGGEAGGVEAQGASQASNPVSSAPTGGSGESSKYKVTIGNLSIPVRAGFSVEGEIPLDTVKIPKSVLTKNNEVYVVDKNNKVKKKKLEIQKRNGEIFVKKGLKTGEKVLKNPKKSLKDGDKVEVSS
ncbi:biotin/lipoyl-binding protein [Staphylococcus massiliensis]|uniref:biotin/lipoyl-binding protein n=1 Tax=Staphylococcus massiliensis TaxID=555791 RepID=UPI001EDF8C0E|nr:efflux RND transporter periplasmic adaptor subunit [Staphylococcus massiliensis]MCG3402239.1 efflux RND transporter periplasmic adaptor subunit [Staphylococcus massiliensis]